jgi:hypothetical protein
MSDDTAINRTSIKHPRDGLEIDEITTTFAQTLTAAHDENLAP